MVSTRVLLLLFLQGLLCGAHVHAQSGMYIEQPKVFTGGIAAGFNLAQVDGDMYFGYNKPGLCAGGFVRIHFAPRLSTQIEMLYSQKGSRGDAVIESPYLGKYVAKCHIGLNYVSVPVTLQYRYSSVTIEAGASYSRLVKTNEWIVAEPPVIVDVVKNRFNNTDLEYVFGAGTKVYKHLFLNLRFQYSILTIRPIDRVPYSYGYGTKGQFNNLFCVRLMYEL
jgi:hypothetical protein